MTIRRAGHMVYLRIKERHLGLLWANQMKLVRLKVIVLSLDASLIRKWIFKK